MRHTTLKELGQQAPIGQVAGSTLAKNFILRPYTVKIDRLMGQWAEANSGLPIAYAIPKYLSLIVERYGNTMLAGQGTVEDMDKVMDWLFADVMYMYIYSRVVNISEKLEVPALCSCKHKFQATADLNSLEVLVADTLDELQVWVPLKLGIHLKSLGIKAKKVLIANVKFRSITTSSHAGLSELNYAQLREAIVKVDGAPDNYILTDEDIDNIPKLDFLCIDKTAGKFAAGAKLRTPIECPKCGSKVISALDWTFDSFFGSSVPPSIFVT